MFQRIKKLTLEMIEKLESYARFFKIHDEEEKSLRSTLWQCWSLNQVLWEKLRGYKILFSNKTRQDTNLYGIKFDYYKKR